MPHGVGYGNDKKMPKKKNDGYGGHNSGSGTKSDQSYYRPMDSYPNKKNHHDY